MTDCKSSPTEVAIDDKSIVYPDLVITQPDRQVGCMPIGTATLMALADGQDDTNPTYSFNWYNTLDLSGPVLASTSTIGSLREGEFSVEVMNSVTGCSSDAPYIVLDESPLFAPQIATGGQERALCVGQDGLVNARVLNFSPVPSGYNFPINFTADLYFGANPNLSGPPDIPNIPVVPGFNMNFSQGGLAEGFYTVRIVDNNTACFAVETEEVEDARTAPVITVNEDNPLINCDPARPNGQLSATADGGKVGGYTFAWYAGMSPSGTVITTTNKLIGQPAGFYAVMATNNITGCSADSLGEITDGTVLPPIPTPEVVFDRTNCITPNGWVTATVEGKILNYIFDWYNGSALKASSDHTGNDYKGLDIGPYTVTAEDATTGCISKPATVQVADMRVIPVLDLSSDPSYCQVTGRNPVGAVYLELGNNGVVLTDIEWYEVASGAPIGNGPQIFGLWPGFYRAEAVSSEGCEAEAEVQVETEVLSYNLVSVNNDGNNDLWIIDCIDLFPNNDVKIFNRAGVKIYEAHGYNNNDVKFTGMGEDGLYVLGNRVPDGTYFYIINKGNGSKPITGFLELVR